MDEKPIVSDPTAVVFISTDANAQNTVSNVESAVGITLQGFFSGNTAPQLDSVVDFGALQVISGISRSPLTQIFVGGDGGPFSDELNFYGDDPVFDMSFSVSNRALTGVARADLSTLNGLPTVGASGDIFAGEIPGGGIIGQWNVVPEPSTAVLMALGLGGLAAKRRRA